MRTIFILQLIIILFVGCASKNQLINISDITKKSEIVLNHTDQKKHIYSIHIGLMGEINGNALITIQDGNNYKKEYNIESGKIDFIINTDWYNSKCILIYDPQDVTLGQLCIEYKFFEQ